jgi:hypothetical protein
MRLWDLPGAVGLHRSVRATARTTSYRSLHSHRSALSIGSLWSLASAVSVGSAASAVSIGSVGSLLSVGSSGSILSIGSVGSILSIGSVGSIGSIGGAGRIGPRERRRPGDANGGAVERPHRFTIERGTTLLAVVALVAATRR